MLTRAELRALAVRAAMRESDWYSPRELCVSFGPHVPMRMEADAAAFVAQCNPYAVLEVLDAYAALEARVAELESVHDTLQGERARIAMFEATVARVREIVSAALVTATCAAFEDAAEEIEALLPPKA